MWVHDKCFNCTNHQSVDLCHLCGVTSVAANVPSRLPASSSRSSPSPLLPCCRLGDSTPPSNRRRFRSVSEKKTRLIYMACFHARLGPVFTARLLLRDEREKLQCKRAGVWGFHLQEPLAGEANAATEPTLAVAVHRPWCSNRRIHPSPGDVVEKVNASGGLVLKTRGIIKAEISERAIK